MIVQKFDQPVSIFVGLGFPCDVASPLEAFELLNEWSGKRGELHSAALSLCRQATTGGADTKAARAALEAFARSRGILAEDAFINTAQRASEEWMPAERH